MKEFVININDKDEYIKVLSNIDGVSKVKYIDTEDLIVLLKSAQIKEEADRKKTAKKWETTILPSSNGVSILYMSESYEDNRKVILKKEACNHNFSVYENTYEKVGLPTMIFSLTITPNNKIAFGSLYCVKDSFITEETKLYRYPFPNVCGNTGSICFGDNNHIKALEVENICDLHSFPSKFFIMPTTHEYATNYNSNLELRPFLELLQNKPFDNSYLIENGKKFKDIL